MNTVNFEPHNMTLQNINMYGIHGSKLRIVDIRIIVLNESLLFKVDMFIIVNVKQHVIQVSLKRFNQLTEAIQYHRCRAYTRDTCKSSYKSKITASNIFSKSDKRESPIKW